jgi:peptidylprolyl isomerase
MGRVISGMSAVDGIAPGEPPDQPTKIVKMWLGDGTPAPVSAAGS